ncbi:hypothetical protein LJR234_005740 [Mesorhizobium amorphae]|uniref:hypothetical protein n=1 Tax=Mesorhizobium amorphae TaxID=71433 RepID=UPI003ECF35FB
MINREPIWWDRYGVPRYAPFRPGGSGRECVLVLARARGGPEYQQLICGYTEQFERAELLSRRRWIPVGDPPAGLHAENGDVSAEAIRVLEYWRRETPLRVWQPEFEIELID